MVYDNNNIFAKIIRGETGDRDRIVYEDEYMMSFKDKDPLGEVHLLVIPKGQYLDYAELQALEENAMTMQDWINTLDRILANNGRALLTGKGSVSHQQAVKKAEYEFEIYRTREMKELESDFDRAIKQIKGIDQ